LSAPSEEAAASHDGSPAYGLSEAVFAEERREFHAGLLLSGALTVNDIGVPSNADKGNKTSIVIAASIARQLAVKTVGERLAAQTSGGQFESSVARFADATFLRLAHLRPGTWDVQKVGGRGASSQASAFEQYAHLTELDDAIKQTPSLRAILGNAYSIAPDIVVSRHPLGDDQINQRELLVDSTVSTLTSMRMVNQRQPLLHAVISCKWTIRSDRAQNARSEALNLIRNRKGRLPHIAVVTGEPLPSRIASIALGTGDIDCVYHFALPELVRAVDEGGFDDAAELLDMMISGRRLRDISDLPLDLAI